MNGAGLLCILAILGTAVWLMYEARQPGSSDR